MSIESEAARMVPFKDQQIAIDKLRYEESRLVGDSMG